MLATTPDFKSLRQDTEALKDPALRKEMQQQLDLLEAEFQETDRKIIDRKEQMARRQVYVAPPKYRIVLLVAFAVSTAIYTSTVILPDMIASGQFTYNRSSVTISANPVLYWLYFVLFAAFAAVGAVIGMAMLVKHPRPPFAGMTNSWRYSGSPDTDLLAEAEVFLSYGRTSDAIEILERARATGPERPELTRKLLQLRQTLSRSSKAK